jgi:predicted ATPase
MAIDNASIYSFDGESIKAVALQQTAHFQLYKNFFTQIDKNNEPKMCAIGVNGVSVV